MSDQPNDPTCSSAEPAGQDTAPGGHAPASGAEAGTAEAGAAPASPSVGGDTATETAASHPAAPSPAPTTTPGFEGATGTPIPPPPPDPNAVTITLDGRPVPAKKGEMLIAAAERAGNYIPRFCYHPRMKAVGVCRMCLVDIKGPRGYSLTPACFTPVSDGMEVVTDSAKVKKAQDGILEFLLVNHPLDCPVCDKGGECPLQDQTLAYGPGETRFIEEKRHWDKPVPLSDLVLIDRERCIQCSRCTRFADEVAGDPFIDFAARGDSIEVAIFPNENFSSNFSGNVVQICPVGALLAKPYRFRARPWDLDQVESTCTSCAVGCRVAVQSSSDELTRYIGVDSDPVNWGWLCDKGRFDYQALNSEDRLGYPLVRKGDELVEASWGEALSAAADGLRAIPGSRVGVIGGARLPNEDAYAWSKLARTVLHTDNVDAQLGDGLSARLIAGLPRATIDETCAAPVIITLAPDIKEELPVLYLRLKHAATESGAALIELAPATTGLSRYSAAPLAHRPGEVGVLVRALLADSAPKGEVAGVAPEALNAARALLAQAKERATGSGPSVVVVLGRPSVAESAGVVEEAARALATIPGVAFLPALRRSNVHGAIDVGLAPGLLPGRIGLEEGRAWFEHHWGTSLPSAGLDTAGMLRAAVSGQLDALVLVGADPLADFPDQTLAARALAAVKFVVAVDAFLTPSAATAQVVLPAAVYAERRGSFTNLEGRVTWLGQKVTAPGVAWPDWMIANELAARLGADLGADSLEGLYAELGRVSPLHANLPLALLVSRQGRNGVVVPASGTASLEVPPPLDPMSDIGIAQAETHPAPPAALSVEGEGVGRSNQPGAGAESLAADGASGDGGLGRPPYMDVAAPASPADAPARNQYALRLVARRPMWDGGTLIQHSPSLAKLHPALALSVHPSELANLGVTSGQALRVSSGRSSLVLPVVADPTVARGVAVLPFNLPGGGAGQLIDAFATVTDVRIETIGGA